MNPDLKAAIDRFKALSGQLQAMIDAFIEMCQLMQTIVPGFICPYTSTMTEEQMLAYATVWEYEQCQSEENQGGG